MSESKTWMRNLLGGACVLLGLTGAGCGRVVPEGYLKINVGLTGSAPSRVSPLESALGDVQAATVCQIPFFRVTAFDGTAAPGFANITASFDSDQYANADPGASIFEARGTLNARTGVRRFVAEAIVRNGCGTALTSAGLQMWGVRDIQVTSGAQIELSMTIAAQYTTASATEAALVLTGGFVRKKVEWTPVGVTGPMTIIVKDLRADQVFSISTSTTVVGSTHYIGPLLPDRQYLLVYKSNANTCTTPAVSGTGAEQLATPFQVDGNSFSAGNCP